MKARAHKASYTSLCHLSSLQQVCETGILQISKLSCLSKMTGEELCRRIPAAKSNAFYNQASVWSTAWCTTAAILVSDLVMATERKRLVCFCYLIHQQPSSTPVPWVQLIYLQDLVGLGVQFWAGSLPIPLGQIAEDPPLWDK